jgi:hypothetical protein
MEKRNDKDKTKSDEERMAYRKELHDRRSAHGSLLGTL